MDTIGSGAQWSPTDRHGDGNCFQTWGRPTRLPDPPSEHPHRHPTGGMPDPLSIILGYVLKNVPVPRR